MEELEPDELRRLVLAAVDPCVDRTVLARQVAREEEQRRAPAAFLGGWGWLFAPDGRVLVLLDPTNAPPASLAVHLSLKTKEIQ
ncbi:hypothetical protein [Streptomyces lydicus]|uniref:hypothetical protein n=1 Tax=Streptomyces lydicus TaxID=47763 RepID=UPI0036EB268A